MKYKSSALFSFWIMLLSLGNILSNLYNFCGREDCWCHNCRYVFPDLLDQPQEFAHWGKISSLSRSGGMTQFHTAVACMQKSTWKSDYSVVGRIWGQRSESKSLWWRSHSRYSASVTDVVVVMWPFWGENIISHFGVGLVVRHKSWTQVPIT